MHFIYFSISFFFLFFFSFGTQSSFSFVSLHLRAQKSAKRTHIGNHQLMKRFSLDCVLFKWNKPHRQFMQINAMQMKVKITICLVNFLFYWKINRNERQKRSTHTHIHRDEMSHQHQKAHSNEKLSLAQNILTIFIERLRYSFTLITQAIRLISFIVSFLGTVSFSCWLFLRCDLCCSFYSSSSVAGTSYTCRIRG